jgi:hypothetical protein
MAAYFVLLRLHKPLDKFLMLDNPPEESANISKITKEQDYNGHLAS